MDVEYYARKFIQTFPEYAQEYTEHIEDYGELLGHVFFGAVINSQLSKLLRINEDKTRIQKYTDFIEDMYANGNEAIRNIVGVTILAYLGDDDKILKNAVAYFSEDVLQESKSIEAGYGRRKMRIYTENGKVQADW